jgi:hypothetical protein
MAKRQRRQDENEDFLIAEILQREEYEDAFSTYADAAWQSAKAPPKTPMRQKSKPLLSRTKHDAKHEPTQEEDGKGKILVKCTICLQDLKSDENVLALPCAHAFHKHEIDAWLAISRTCPVCKYSNL